MVALDVDYLVVGAGAAGLAFTDALVAHADVRVALVDRRDRVGGHWVDAYPFVRLHQASVFYGVASRVLGGEVQTSGPEAGLHERATGAEVCAYFDGVLHDVLLPSGKVTFLPGVDHVPDQIELPQHCRVVNAHHMEPTIPSRSPAPWQVEVGSHVVPANDVPTDAGEYVVVGSGKTATDTCLWLLQHGVDPDDITWVRPRDPWMLNRAVIQPDPAVYLGMAADVMECAAAATSLDELFLALEERGVMLRIDPAVAPTMARCPTLGAWELDLLRSLTRVVRRGHLRSTAPGVLRFADGDVQVARDAVVVHCAAYGLRDPARVPVWQPDAITLQPVRAGFPCFGAALTGYVEATRTNDDEKNRLCPPNSYGNSLRDWALMNLRGTRASQVFGAEPDIGAWADQVRLNPASVPQRTPAVEAVLARLGEATPAGLAQLEVLTR